MKKEYKNREEKNIMVKKHAYWNMEQNEYFEAKELLGFRLPEDSDIAPRQLVRIRKNKKLAP